MRAFDYLPAIKTLARVRPFMPFVIWISTGESARRLVVPHPSSLRFTRNGRIKWSHGAGGKLEFDPRHVLQIDTGVRLESLLETLTKKIVTEHELTDWAEAEMVGRSRSMKHDLAAILASVNKPTGGKRLRAFLSQQPFPHYEQGSKRGMLIKINADGSREEGRFVNRSWVAGGKP